MIYLSKSASRWEYTIFITITNFIFFANGQVDVSSRSLSLEPGHIFQKDRHEEVRRISFPINGMKNNP